MKYVTTANNENESGVIEKTINLAEIGSKMEATVGEADSAIKPGCPNTKELVESACKILVEQVLKKCPNVNLSSITIKTTTAKSNNDSTVAKDASETKTPSIAMTTGSNSNINATTSTTTTQIIQLKPTTLEISSPKPARNKHRFEDSGSTTASISPSSHSTTSSSSSIDTSIVENAAKKLRTSDDEKLKVNTSKL